MHSPPFSTGRAREASSCGTQGAADQPYDGNSSAALSNAAEISPATPSNAPVSTGSYLSNLCRVLIFGQKRCVFGAIKRELRRHSSMDPVDWSHEG